MSRLAPSRLQGGRLLLSLFLLIHSLPRFSSSQLQNADYSGKVNVKVSEILTRRPNAADRSWPPENSNEFAKININILGQRIDGTTFHNLKPSQAHTSRHKLLKILGSDFNIEWMSIEDPDGRSDPKNLPKTDADKNLLKQLNSLNFSFVDRAGAHVQLQPQYLQVWKNWLLRQATCPINYFWEDLGALFWPRWVRRGHCVPTSSCSWPHGMHCGPSHSRNLILLQWKCLKDSDQEKAKREAADRDLGINRRGRRGNRRGWRRRKQFRRRTKQQRHRSPWPSSSQSYRSVRARDGRYDTWARRPNDLSSRSKRSDQSSRYPPWQVDRNRKKKKRKKKRHNWELRRKRRLRRLIRKLSMVTNGYYCEWSKTNYIVNDRCSCMCPS